MQLNSLGEWLIDVNHIKIPSERFNSKITHKNKMVRKGEGVDIPSRSLTTE